MDSSRRNVVVVAIILFLIYLPASVQAADNFNLKPKISASWQSDSNFYKAEAVKREVYTYLVQPGFEFGYQTAKSSVLLDYTMDLHYYDDQDPVPAGQTPTDNYDFTGHTLGFSALTQPSDRLTLGLDEFFLLTRDSGLSDAFSNDIDLDKYYINRLAPYLRYKFGPVFSAGLKYQNIELDYSPDTREDHTEHRSIFDLEYNFTRMTALDLEYQIWERSYSGTSSTFTSNQVKLILKKQFQYFTVEAGGGYHDREFDDSTIQDIDLFTYHVVIEGQNPPAPEARPRSYVSLSADRNFNDSGEGDTYFTGHKFALSAGYIFMEKLPLDITARYQNSDYETQTGTTPEGTVELRDDDKYEISGQLGYIITDDLLFAVKAGYEDRDSNLRGYDYDNKYFMIKIDFGYELGRR